MFNSKLFLIFALHNTLNGIWMIADFVIFDLDGTLLNTIGDLAAACNHVMETNGYPTYGLDDYKRFAGSGVRRLVELALPSSVPQAEVERMRNEFVEYYGLHIDNETVPYDGIPELLHYLQEAGITMAVASNKFHEGTCRLVKKYFPEIRFSSVFGQRPGIPLKPDPAVIYEILETAGYAGPSGSVVFVGDSGIDMDTAHAAGIVSVGVSWGFRSLSELVEHEAEYIVDGAGALKDLVFNLKDNERQ